MFNTATINIVLCLMALSISNKNMSFAHKQHNSDGDTDSKEKIVAQELWEKEGWNIEDSSYSESISKRNLRPGGRYGQGGRGGSGAGAGAGAGTGGAGVGTGAGGRGNGNGFGRSDEMDIIQNLIDNRNDISRTVLDLGDGVFQTETTSDRSEVAEWIQEHVTQMTALVEAGGVVRQWDPLFVAMFENIADVQVEGSLTDNGVIVTLEGLTPCGMSLAEAHARLVSDFIAIGRAEVRSAHPVPEACL